MLVRQSGLREPHASGRIPGHKPKITAEQQREIVEAASSERKTTVEIARVFKIHRATASRFISQAPAGF